jgi:septal ring factor EnvC (AmiA/AmiB activator)
MAKHSKAERERRQQQNELTKQIEAAWRAATPAAAAKEFEQAVAAARARGPEPRRPDMAPGTAPRPPRPGREPKPPKESAGRGRGR